MIFKIPYGYTILWIPVDSLMQIGSMLRVIIHFSGFWVIGFIEIISNSHCGINF